MRVLWWDKSAVIQWLVVLGVMLGLGGTSASADEITLDFSGFHFGESAAFTAVTNRGTVIAGASSWNVTSGGEAYGIATGQEITTFTTEIVQSVFSESSGQFELTDLEAASPGDDGLGGYRAGLIQSLYNQYGSESLSSARAAAAFQLAIWEIVYETEVDGEGALVLDAAAGEGFVVTDGGVTLESYFGPDSALALSNQWLATLTSVQVTSLLGLSDNHSADQILSIVPLPMPVTMAAVGLLMLPLIRRRRWTATRAAARFE